MSELMWACAILPEKEETAIRSICKRLNKGVGLPETVFWFPLHISLKKSWDCDRFEAAQTDVADYLKHCGSFDIDIGKPIMHKNMIWLPVCVTEKLQEIHNGLDLLLERKYAVPRTAFDTSFHPHISLFTKGDHRDMAAMHELLVKETMPQTARIRNVVMAALSIGIPTIRFERTIMKYRRNGDQILIRIDKGEEILDIIRKICTAEKIYGAVFSGIGACSKAVVSSYIPEENDFTNHEADGLLELISLSGNISREDNAPFEHTHALFSYLEDGEQKMLAGHLKHALVSYTAEIHLTVTDTIEKAFDPTVGITVWDL